jgi:CDP-6-deoxy-D-xylo-4-hexulose-3-dehydrase
METNASELKNKIIELTKEYSRLTHKSGLPGSNPNKSYKAGDTVPYAGRVYDENEVASAVSSMLDFWLTLGKEGDKFCDELAKWLGVKTTVLTNSGSSANLLAISALSSPRLGDRRVKKGDEIITVAAGFPTTVAPIIQNGFVPVFIDNRPDTLNVDVRWLEEAYREGKTKAVMIAHTLGNPFDLSTVTEFCKKHNLWLIEDNCDALGCTYDGVKTGTFGDLSTQSFYPPHHLTLGEGGSINIVKDMKLKMIVESFRDWGRDCWCASGVDNTCHKRFNWQLGDLPKGYDHKFIYSHLGYNLKPLDPQAAIGLEQLKKLDGFVTARSENWQFLRKNLNDLSEYFDFMLPTHAEKWLPSGEFQWDKSGHKTNCSWFGFMLSVKPNAPFKKFDFARHLDEKKIGNRMLFGGNLLRQPVFKQLQQDEPNSFRVIGDLKGADTIMDQSLFIGTYPGLSKKMMEYVVDVIHQYVKRF